MERIFYEIEFIGSTFDEELDDFVEDTFHGPIYATEEEANKYKKWFDSEPKNWTCRVVKIAERFTQGRTILDKFEPRR